MAERQLTSAQRAKYEDIKKNRGAAAASAYRTGIISAKVGGEANNPAPKSESPKAESSPDGHLLTKAQRDKYEKIRREDGAAAGKKYRDGIIAKNPSSKGSNTAGEAPKGTTGSTTGDGEKPPLNTGDPNIDKASHTTDVLFPRAIQEGQTMADTFLPKGSFQGINAATTPEMQAYLNRLNEEAQAAKNYTGYEQQSIDQLQGGLGGYLGPEQQAMREQAMNELNRQYQTSIAQLARQQARGGVRGGAATAQMQDLGTGKVQATGNFERDLLVKNADEQQRRREAFANLIRSTEDARFGRTNQAESLYGGQLGGEEAARTARETYNSTGVNNENLTRAGIGAAGAGTYLGTVGSTAGQSNQQNYLDFLAKQQEEQNKLSMALINRNNQQIKSLGV